MLRRTGMWIEGTREKGAGFGHLQYKKIGEERRC